IDKESGEILGRTSRRKSHLAKEMENSSRMEGAVRQVVRWRQAQCFGELSRPAPGGTNPEQGRLDLGRRAGREGNADISAAAPGGLQVRECSEAEPCQERGPRRHLHVDVSRSGGCDARLRENRGDSFGCI